MKKSKFAAAAVLIMCGMTGTSYAALEQFAGTWKNVKTDTGGITTLEIDVTGTTVKIRAWGSCTPKDCDWGSVSALPYAPNISSDLSETANALTAEFRTGFSNTLLVVKLPKGGALRVDAFTHFTKGNRTDYFNAYKFKAVNVKPVNLKPMAMPSVKEDCVGFNPATTKVSRVGRNWKIVDGSHWLFDFGSNKSEADKSLQIIKRYRMNKSCFVGRPNPSFKYMLVNDNAPSGSGAGEDCISFNPGSIDVANNSGRWKIVDGSHYMFDFGNEKAEANQALAVIRKHGFTKSCFVGRPDPGFEYLRK